MHQNLLWLNLLILFNLCWIWESKQTARLIIEYNQSFVQNEFNLIPVICKVYIAFEALFYILFLFLLLSRDWLNSWNYLHSVRFTDKLRIINRIIENACQTCILLLLSLNFCEGGENGQILARILLDLLLLKGKFENSRVLIHRLFCFILCWEIWNLIIGFWLNY